MVANSIPYADAGDNGKNRKSNTNRRKFISHGISGAIAISALSQSVFSESDSKTKKTDSTELITVELNHSYDNNIMVNHHDYFSDYNIINGGNTLKVTPFGESEKLPEMFRNNEYIVHAVSTYSSKFNPYFTSNSILYGNKTNIAAAGPNNSLVLADEYPEPKISINLTNGFSTDINGDTIKVPPDTSEQKRLDKREVKAYHRNGDTINATIVPFVNIINKGPFTEFKLSNFGGQG